MTVEPIAELGYQYAQSVRAAPKGDRDGPLSLVVGGYPLPGLICKKRRLGELRACLVQPFARQRSRGTRGILHDKRHANPVRTAVL